MSSDELNRIVQEIQAILDAWKPNPKPPADEDGRPLRRIELD